MRRSWRRLVVVPVAVVLAVAGLSMARADATQGFCGQVWGSLPKHLGNNDPGSTLVTGARAGRHACFDRLTVDLTGPPASYRVEYVPQVTSDGSGAPIPLRGGAFLSIVLGAQGIDANGQATYRPANRSEAVNVSGYTTFRQVAFDTSFEGLTSFGLGVRAKLPFRVFVLAGPGSGTRLVVDVSHRWS
ncbi:MAG TPA: hypothetical protein VGP53_09260 [Acidimicrobiales bacterium]|nr:hypothetical protein [Acidimicrobiales bacterium]